MSGCNQCTDTIICHWCAKKNKPKKPIKPRSDKRAKLDAIYNARVKVWKLENPACMARLDGCTGKTTDCHHIEPRTERNLLIEDNWMPVCSPCHRKITDGNYIEVGLSKSRNKKTQ